MGDFTGTDWGMWPCFAQDPWPLLQLLQGSVQSQSGKDDSPAGGSLIFSLCAFTELLCCWHGCHRGNWRRESPLDVLLHEFSWEKCRNCCPAAGKRCPVHAHGLCSNPPQRHSTPGFSICSCLNLGKCSCKPAPSAEEPL